MSRWEKIAPWFLTLFSILSIIMLSYFVFTNTNWLSTSMKSDQSLANQDYFLSCYLIYTSMIKRTIGLFSALCLIFIGLGLSAYVTAKQSKIEIKDAKWSVSLATASPGIIALVLGVVLMISDINSKDTFNFQGISNSAGYQTSSVLNKKFDFDK